jgi:hypothetical protein
MVIPYNDTNRHAIRRCTGTRLLFLYITGIIRQTERNNDAARSRGRRSRSEGSACQGSYVGTKQTDIVIRCTQDPPQGRFKREHHGQDRGWRDLGYVADEIDHDQMVDVENEACMVRYSEILVSCG